MWGGLHPVVVFTDHITLTFIQSLQNYNQRLMALFLQAYRLVIRHSRGRKNVMAEALSGRPGGVGMRVSVCLSGVLFGFRCLVCPGAEYRREGSIMRSWVRLCGRFSWSVWMCSMCGCSLRPICLFLPLPVWCSRALGVLLHIVWSCHVLCTLTFDLENVCLKPRPLWH